MQAVCAIGADDVVVDERVLGDRTADQRVVVGIVDGDPVQRVAQGPVAVGRGSDEIAAEDVVPGVRIDPDAALPVDRGKGRCECKSR